ncbi:MAG TPA: MEDS domain-containing protein [Propionibacteriaceae bacterium]|nr:MEDS domain-containing protein [Propionibacteriaceae bacterium]
MSKAPPRSRQSYRHEALLWSDAREFASVLSPFIQEGLAAGEPVMVALIREHANWLRDTLGAEARKVKFVDMAALGSNPARIIPAWQSFLDDHSADGKPVRGIGEPIWAGRGPEEILECQLHEALLNVAVDPKTPLWLICPYDVRGLDPDVIEEAHRSHLTVMEGNHSRGHPLYGGRTHVDAMFEAELPPLGGEPGESIFTLENVESLFGIVTLDAYAAGLGSDKISDLASTVRRLGAASLSRGATQGRLRIWHSPQALVCEVSDDTVIDDVLVGRRSMHADGPDGLWQANELCDLVQVRSGPAGTAVRLYIWK